MRTAFSRGSSGPAHQRTGTPSSSATWRKFSSGQRLCAPLANGWITAKSPLATGGTEMLGTPGGGGSAGKNVNGRWRTASRNSDLWKPYQEWMESKPSRARVLAPSTTPTRSRPVSAMARTRSAKRIKGSIGRGTHTSVYSARAASSVGSDKITSPIAPGRMRSLRTNLNPASGTTCARCHARPGGPTPRRGSG